MTENQKLLLGAFLFFAAIVIAGLIGDHRVANYLMEVR